MAATVTLTGVVGPGVAVTTQVYTNITFFTIDAVNNVINMVQGSIPLPTVSVNAATTVTATKSGATWTLTIS